MLGWIADIILHITTVLKNFFFLNLSNKCPSVEKLHFKFDFFCS